MQNEYAQASRRCDIVMKGGITSGVVYPRAVCELAKTFRFRNIGGTSAGAIAAAATAAAEYGRKEEGFERLAALPEWLGERGNLPSLFQPQRRTRGLFKIVLAAIEHGLAWAAAVAFLRNLPMVVIGGLAGAGLVSLAGTGGGIWAFVLYALTIALGAVTALALFLGAKVLRAVPANGFGLCSGWTPASEQVETGPIPLTPWLYRTLNAYAYLPDEEPLTFGHLWAGPERKGQKPPEGREDRFVELAMMTTNLTNRRAHQLPLEDAEWLFCPEQLRDLFPEPVVAWMEHRASPTAEVLIDDDGRERRLRWLPKPEDVPIIVATRLSLSFPVLLSAVPLWRCEGGPEALALRGSVPSLSDQGPRPRLCWFSDGGISSNFPIHFFDGLVPRWPTFGINLRPFRDGDEPSRDQRQNTWMVATEREEIPDWWYPNDGLKDFLLGIGNTMQNRADEAQMRIPGYRDRIAHVSLAKQEGGMNLTMKEDVINALIERGGFAAERLRTAYATDAEGDGVTWDGHRWARLRSTLAVLDEMHGRFVKGYDDRDFLGGGRSYEALVERGAGDPPDDFRWTGDEQKKRAAEEIDAIREAGSAGGASMDSGAPEPQPVGRIEPRA
jgi:predicted acylesterase/phospholipase RssA